MSRRFSCFAILVVVLAPLAERSVASADETERPKRPALVVVIAIDQFRFEYLERYGGNFADDGFFRRIAREGASFTNCHHAHAFTLTGPGHAVMLSGAFPRRTGIIDNNWYNRDTKQSVYCVADSSSPIVGKSQKASGVSPKNLLVETAGDSLRRTTRGKGKVVGIAMKDRAAVLMAGRHPTACYWFESTTGQWVSSLYYVPSNKLPAYLAPLNAADSPLSATRYADQKWELLLPLDRYQQNYPDDYPFERPPTTLGRTFPHSLPSVKTQAFFEQLVVTPFGNELTLDAALHVAEAEELGRDDIPDLLVLNLSSNDYVGHAFGPNSLEVDDMTCRTDRLLGKFLVSLEKQLAGRPLSVCLTSDHGVAPIPEYAKEKGLPGQRDALGNLKELTAKINARLNEELAPAGTEKPISFVQNFDGKELYLNRSLKELAGDRFAEAQRTTRAILAELPAVEVAMTREELAAGKNTDRRFFEELDKSFCAERSGDVLVVLKPYCVLGKTSAATHGSPYEYDTHVPLMLWGAGIRAGTLNEKVNPAMLGPTVSHLLGTEAPSKAEVPALDSVLLP